MGRQAVAAWCYVCLPVESIPAAGMAGAIRASAKPASRSEDAVPQDLSRTIHYYHAGEDYLLNLR